MFKIQEKIKTLQAKSLQWKSFKYCCQLKNLKRGLLREILYKNLYFWGLFPECDPITWEISQQKDIYNSIGSAYFSVWLTLPGNVKIQNAIFLTYMIVYLTESFA